MLIAYTANKIFTGNEWLTDSAIVVENGIIKGVHPINTIAGSCTIKNYRDCFIAPAFIDIQIYGAAEKLFAVYPEAESLHQLYTYCLSGGAHYFLPTVATNTTEVFFKCIDAVRSYWNNGGKGVYGLHIEGPWINKAKKGAHIASLIHSPTLSEVQQLLSYGEGVIKMITLAPEVCSNNVLDLIRSRGIVVSAGHSNATFKQSNDAFNNGISVATHLFNAMSGLNHREPGMVGAVMSNPGCMSSIIADGHHVSFEVIAIAKKVMDERLFLITDAVTETTQGPYPHQKDFDKYISNGILSGSALTMLKSVKNCVDHGAITLDESLRMASLYPAKAVGLQQTLGRIAPGYKASFVVLTKDLELKDNIIS